MSSETPQSLEHITVLSDLTPEARHELERRCHWHRYGPHVQIIDRASDSHDVYFVVEGRVRVVNYSYAGREVSYDDIGAGGMFGELAAIDGAPRSATVVALAETVTAAVPPEIFVSLVREHPDLAVTMMLRLVQIIRGSTDRIMDLSTLRATGRIHTELLRLSGAGKEDESAEIRPMPVHADIASRVGTTRETVARAVSDLARRGIVRKEGHDLVIVEVVRLRELAEEG